MGRLYLVATPIGNLEDTSARALRVLREVALIAAEDTRQTAKLLAHYEIHTQSVSYFEHNKLAKLGRILGSLAAGDVALVSDAGTPGLNDPGYELVRAALAAGHSVIPIPGPCAPVTALVASGLPTDSFLYLGYLPRRSAQRRSLLTEVLKERRTLVALEAPHRLVESLADVLAILGDRPIAVARELTKIHEEFVRGNVSDAIRRFQEKEPLGEITLVIGGAAATDRWTEEALRVEIRSSARQGLTTPQAASRIAAESGWEKREVYRLLQEEKNSSQRPRIPRRK